MKIVPLVLYLNNQPEVVGEARIDIDGNITGIIKRGHPALDVLLDSNQQYSFIVNHKTEKEKDNGIH